jgi:superfamily I DNA/RNA helicase
MPSPNGLLGRRKAGYEWGEMAVLYPEHWIGERFVQALKKHDVPVDVVKEEKNRVSLKRPAVRLLSTHTAKGLEFPCVGVGGLGAVGRHGEEIEDCVRLVYVAVTRATHEVFLTYSQESDVVRLLIT